VKNSTNRKQYNCVGLA